MSVQVRKSSKFLHKLIIKIPSQQLFVYLVTKKAGSHTTSGPTLISKMRVEKLIFPLNMIKDTYGLAQQTLQHLIVFEPFLI